MAFARTTTHLLHPEIREHFQNAYIDQATASFLKLSFGMGAIAALLPIALMLADRSGDHWSISSYYYVQPGGLPGGTARNLLVGALWATGAFLFLFRGLSRAENWLLNLAGLSGISVAMNPMAADQCARKSGFPVHGASAAVFFLCLAIVAIGYSKKRVQFITDKRMRRRFITAYNVVGAAMVIMPATVVAIHYLARTGCTNPWIFWVESLGIWAFAIYWFIKTAEYRILLAARVGRTTPSAPPAIPADGAGAPPSVSAV